MAVQHGVVDLTITAVDLTVETLTHDYHNTSRILRVENSGSSEVFLGGSNVSSTSYGVRLAAGANISFDLASDDELFAVVAPVASPGVAAGQVRLLHTGL